MKLYHPGLLITLVVVLLTACQPVPAPSQMVEVFLVTAVGETPVIVPAGSTVDDVLSASDVSLSTLDRVDPPGYTVLPDGGVVRLIRVSEEFDVEEVIIPFESRTLRNETLPEGEKRLIQAGENGLQENTYRRLYEDDLEVSRSLVKSIVITAPVAEIVMVGTRGAFTPISLPGKIAYLIGGNAWILSGETGERIPVVTTGDLDGRIFSLSLDGDWLLFTRKSAEDGQINSLWAASLDGSGLLVDLEGRNVVHYAGWVPNRTLQVAYSTVEPREAAPGWQANNDLIMISFSPTGWVSDPSIMVDANAGGIYGWWGSFYLWSDDGSRLAFARPDGVGLINMEDGSQSKLFDFTPLQTYGDWAWVPGTSWSPDGFTLFTVDHPGQSGDPSSETSPVFDLLALSPAQQAPLRLVSQAGMFAYPVPSPFYPISSGGQGYQVAYLQALFPAQSETSLYRLVLVDRDGSDRREIFPPSDSPGLEPQRVFWSPAFQPNGNDFDLALIYQDNIWLVDSESGNSRQLTSDGLVSRIDWK